MQRHYLATIKFVTTDPSTPVTVGSKLNRQTRTYNRVYTYSNLNLN